jgi:hypothetical protein
MPLFAEEGIWVDAGALTRSCLTQLFATMGWDSAWDSGTLLTRWTNYSGDFRGATAPLGSFPQTTSGPPISTRRISIFITAVGPAPLMQDQIPILVMVCPSRKQRPAFPYQCPGSQRLQVVAQNPRGLPHHRQSAVVQCLLPSRGAACLDYRASLVSAYLSPQIRHGNRQFVQLVNSVPLHQHMHKKFKPVFVLPEQ